MGRHSERVREELLDAAEELFARDGIDAVSNRRITEHAQMSNHSAVAYHFGSRDDLLLALVERHVAAVELRQIAWAQGLGQDPSLNDLVRCRLLPFVAVLDALPQPSWRARFLAQLQNAPSAAEVLKQATEKFQAVWEGAELPVEVVDVPSRILHARSTLLGQLVLGVCAEYERQVEAGINEGTWLGVGSFLADSAAGMLGAQVTDATNPAVVADRSPLV